MMSAQVSVIIPTHNRVASLQKAVQSVLGQTFQDFEIIIINDASTDGTAVYLAGLINTDPRIHVITNTEPLCGSQSRNLGIQLSQGHWLAFLDDDDVWMPEKLEIQLQTLAANPGAVAVTCGYSINYPLGIKKQIHPPANVSLEKLLRANILGGASVCMGAAAVIKKMGGFDPKLRSAQDWDLWIKLRKEGAIAATAAILVQYHVHFKYRISNDMTAKYSGARKFYFKYKFIMSPEAKTRNLAFLLFIKSRQNSRHLKSRLHNLILACQYSPVRVGLAYGVSSLPRLVLNCFF
jgi:glycosyltransferase involved in cell wall biosynthesis